MEILILITITFFAGFGIADKAANKILDQCETQGITEIHSIYIDCSIRGK